MTAAQTHNLNTEADHLQVLEDTTIGGIRLTVAEEFYALEACYEQVGYIDGQPVSWGSQASSKVHDLRQALLVAAA